MSDTRRYDEEEIAEILERATSDEGAVQPAAKGSGQGLSLTEIQEIGSEVGIAPERIAEAARAMSSRDLIGTPKTFLGAPRSVSRIVPIPRALDDDEWTRLVVDLRETFGAMGKIRTEGSLRSWNNGNLQVHVEPDGDRYRVRMRTVKGNVIPRTVMSVAFLSMAVVMALDGYSGGATLRALIPVVLSSLGGLGVFGHTVLSLPGWAAERAAQMEGLAQRIPLLLKDKEG